MTVSATSSSRTFECDGISTLFACNFRILTAAELRVYRVTKATGESALLTLGVDYTITGAGSDTFTVQTVAVYSSLYRLRCSRKTSRLQTTDYRDNDPFPAETHERALDRLTMIAQEDDEALTRTIVAPEGESFAALPGAPDRALRLLGFDALGQPIATLPTPGDATALALDLVTPGNAGKAAGMVVWDKTRAYAAGTVGAKLNESRQASDYTAFADYIAATEPAGFWAPDGFIRRERNRLLVGASARNDGKLPATDKDWLETERQYTTQNAQFGSLSTIGQIAVLGGSRSSDNDYTGSMGCIGITGYAINDNAGEVQTAYAGYFEARRKSGAGVTHGIELDIVNEGSVVTAKPFTMVSAGITPGLWVASGGEVVGATIATMAIGIVNNGATFEKGLVFGNSSIYGTDGVTGNGVAIAMAKGHIVAWYNSGGDVVGAVTTNTSSSAAAQHLQFTDLGLTVSNWADNGTLLRVPQVASATSHLRLMPAAAGDVPQLTVDGAATNIDMKLGGKGTGVLHITQATIAGSAGSSLGYLTVKVNGTAAKIQLLAA